MQILDNDEVGDSKIYWIMEKDPPSEYPIPPDVRPVESLPDEMTVSEFFDQNHVMIGVWSAIVTVIGSGIIWVGGLLGTQVLPEYISSGNVVAVGLIAVMIGYIGFLVALGELLMKKNNNGDYTNGQKG